MSCRSGQPDRICGGLEAGSRAICRRQNPLKMLSLLRNVFPMQYRRVFPQHFSFSQTCTRCCLVSSASSHFPHIWVIWRTESSGDIEVGGDFNLKLRYTQACRMRYFGAFNSPQLGLLISKGCSLFKKKEYNFAISWTEVVSLSKLIWPGHVNQCWCYFVDMLCEHWIEEVNAFYKDIY